MNQEPNVRRLPDSVTRDLETLFELDRQCRRCKFFDPYMERPERGMCSKRSGRVMDSDDSCHRFERR